MCGKAEHGLMGLASATSEFARGLDFTFHHDNRNTSISLNSIFILTRCMLNSSKPKPSPALHLPSSSSIMTEVETSLGKLRLSDEPRLLEQRKKRS